MYLTAHYWLQRHRQQDKNAHVLTGLYCTIHENKLYTSRYNCIHPTSSDNSADGLSTTSNHRPLAQMFCAKD